MDDARIPTELWLSAQLRTLDGAGMPHYIVHRGAPAAGTVMLKLLVRGQGCRLFNQTRDIDGNLGWMDVFDGALVDEAQADAYISRSVSRDPDLWGVEIESNENRNPLEGKVF